MNAKAAVLLLALAAAPLPALAQDPLAALPAPTAASQDQTSVGPKVALPNAVAGERLKRPAKAADRGRIQAAIAAGDARQVYALGGTAQDVVQVLAAAG